MYLRSRLYGAIGGEGAHPVVSAVEDDRAEVRVRLWARGYMSERGGHAPRISKEASGSERAHVRYTSYPRGHALPRRQRLSERTSAAGLAAGHACAERIVPRGVEIEAA